MADMCIEVHMGEDVSAIGLGGCRSTAERGAAVSAVVLWSERTLEVHGRTAKQNVICRSTWPYLHFNARLSTGYCSRSELFWAWLPAT